MEENRWYDERFIKCKNCKETMIVFPLIGDKWFRCKNCGTKTRNREYERVNRKEKRYE